MTRISSCSAGVPAQPIMIMQVQEQTLDYRLLEPTLVDANSSDSRPLELIQKKIVIATAFETSINCNQPNQSSKN